MVQIYCNSVMLAWPKLKVVYEMATRISGIGRRPHKYISISQLHSSKIHLKTENNSQKTTKQSSMNLVFPKLAENVKTDLQTIASFHFTNSALSWAKMSLTHDLLEWDIVDIPCETNKIHLTTIYEMVLKITSLLPKADLYVMEEMNKPKQSSGGAVLANLYLLQFRAIFLAYLNNFHLPNGEFDVSRINKVYFLRSHVAARLSSTLVGGEKVSVEETIINILDINEHNSVCPQFSPINVDWYLKQKYVLKENLVKENMGQALLLIMSFIDLVISKRPESIKYITHLR